MVGELIRFQISSQIEIKENVTIKNMHYRTVYIIPPRFHANKDLIAGDTLS